jgi:hypothetical protein
MCSCIAHGNYVVVVPLVLVLWGVPLPLLLYSRGWGYKEGPQVGYNCSPSRTISLVFSNYKIWSYLSRTLSLRDILPPSCRNMGLCRPHGPAEPSQSCTLGTYPQHYATCPIDVKRVVIAGRIRLVQLKHVVKHLHRPEWELTYNVVVAYVPNSSALKVIHFKFHDQLRQRLIRFQSATLETTQNKESFCAYWHSVKLHPIISATLIIARGWLLNACMTNEPMNFSIRARGSWSMYLSTSNTFYTCNIGYKNQGAPDQHTSLLLLLFTGASLRTKKGAPDRRTSLLLIHFTHASPHTKSKGLLINISLYFSYKFIIMYEK